MKVRPPRLGLILALVAAITATGWLLLRSDSEYALEAEFVNAGGLVEGGRVQIAGRPVGRISRIELSKNGLAKVRLQFGSDQPRPLRAGTRATIRAVGQAGLTNRFVDIAPGPSSGAPLEDGAMLPTQQTQSIVPLDSFFNAFGPKQRADLQRLVINSSEIYAGAGSRYVSDMLAKLDPALGELSGLSQELANNNGAIGQLVEQGREAASAVASRSDDLTRSVRDTATGLAAIADEQDALVSSLEQLPPVLRIGRRALARTSPALRTLRPAFRAVADVERPLSGLLTRLSRTLPRGGAVAERLRVQLPQLNRSLSGLRKIDKPSAEAMKSLGPAMRELRPIVEGLRYYGTDVVLGTLAALFGVVSAEYDATGHYIKANFVQSYQTFVQGPIGALLTEVPGIPELAVRTGLTRRCPGGNQPPAPDGSSPWHVGQKLCDPEHDLPASVDGG